MEEEEVDGELVDEGYDPVDPDDVDVPTGKGVRGAQLTEREIRAVELRKAGYTFQEIASALGWEHKSSAMRAVRRALRRWGSENVQELRMLELSRLDTMTQKLWPMILGRPGTENSPPQPPDINAMMAYLRVSQRRSQLLGLDAPAEIDLTFGEGTDKTDAERLVDDVERFSAIIESVVAGRPPAVGSGLGDEDAGEPPDDDQVRPVSSD